MRYPISKFEVVRPGLEPGPLCFASQVLELYHYTTATVVKCVSKINILSYIAGCICVYSSSESLEFLTKSLEVTLKPDLTREGEENNLKMPVIIIQVPNTQLSEKDLLKLRDGGRDLAHV